MHRHPRHAMGHGHGPGPLRMVFGLAFALFYALGFVSLLWAVHRIARALSITARLKTLDRLEAELTDEERRTLVERVRRESLGRY